MKVSLRGIDAYNQVFKEAEKDKDILGLILTGSRGKGIFTENSDFDLYLIVRDKTRKYFEKKYHDYCAIPNQLALEMGVLELSSFRGYANFGGPLEYERYAFAHVKAQVDKTNGEIQKLIDEKSVIPKNRLRQLTKRVLDGYINSVYRSLKCLRDGNESCARLEAQSEVPQFVTALFALDRRMSPYPKYLAWELENYPVRQFPMPSYEIMQSIMKIADTADLSTQQKILTVSHRVFSEQGYEKVFDNWQHIIHWMETMKLRKNPVMYK